LLTPLGGEVLVDGKRPGNGGEAPGSGPAVGMVFQNPHAQITSLTVERELAFGLQNMRLPSADLRSRVEEELLTWDLAGCRNDSPRSLSAGEQQRLALAAVLATRPAYLILDEATSLLSPASRVRLLGAVQHDREARGTGVMLITQFAGEAHRADRLIVLREGRVAMDGPPARLFTAARELAALGVRVPLRYASGAAR
jgi:energy-coupling factor transport system ATP-binding protein